jgi:hypothetical protein
MNSLWAWNPSPINDCQSNDKERARVWTLQKGATGGDQIKLSINQLPPSATTYFPENKIWGIFSSIHTISSPPSTPFSFPHHHQRTITLNSATDFEHQIIWL